VQHDLGGRVVSPDGVVIFVHLVLLLDVGLVAGICF
jgi:hypothetical protein